MAIDYEKLKNKLSPGVWYSGNELSHTWKLPHVVRKARANSMYHKGMLARQGKTANVQYKLATNEAAPKIKPISTNSLDSLIAAASKVGTENEILKTALKEAKAAIERAFEAIK